MTTEPQPAQPDDLEIVSTRVFTVPRDRVFEMFSNPEHLVHWWGPKGFTNAFQEFDFRPGGAWRFTMQGPDGANYPMENYFLEIASPQRIVFKHVQTGHNFQMTMTFDDTDGPTRLTWRMRFEAVAEIENIRDFLIAAGEENFDRLQAYLAQSQTSNSA